MERLLSRGTVPATLTTAYTVPTGTQLRVTKAFVRNDDTTTRTVTIYFVPSGGTADATNKMCSHAVDAGDRILLPELGREVLEEGGTIQHVADTASVILASYNGQVC